MKKTIQCISVMFSLLGLLLLQSTAYSQIEVTSNDVLGLIGGSQTQLSDTTGSTTVNVGSSGANRTWDFSSLNIQGETYSVDFVSPTGTPFESDFPEANFAEQSGSMQQGQEFTTYLYFQITSSNFSTLGGGLVTPDTSYKSFDSQDVAPLPLQFGTNWTSTESDTFGDPQTFAFVTETTSENTVDAWGTVILPIGSFPCLRIRSNDTEVSQTFVNGSPINSEVITNIDYTWISKDNFAVASVGSQDNETNPDFTNANYVEILSSGAVDVADRADHAGVPTDFLLAQNFPNPFNPETSIRYGVPGNASVELVIFNLLGEKVRTLVDEVQPSGDYEVHWDGRNDFGQPVTSGVYYYRLKSGNVSLTKKMILLQ